VDVNEHLDSIDLPVLVPALLGLGLHLLQQGFCLLGLGEALLLEKGFGLGE